ncbi:hypothetical protein UA08_09220 [Talaromyces atroroseus]|uniref:EthD domain-containing protein n=1 Tax=Talaromyces atroroseus TaxID=1441469 RepID=A0A1Q5Q6L4_TALAT|nr:hypothetical protein UA08_09220 [Talaromyces atroroseus]OKL55484.1 hypothetical protein UA08_09220 [Talaromyces atroroseus]
MASDTKGLLYVLVSPGELLSMEELHTWFHGQCTHNQPGLTLLNANIYEAADTQKPEWLAVYELESVHQAERWLYQLQPLSRFETVEARIYRLFSEKISPFYDATSAPNRVFRTVALQPGPELSEKNYNEWYEDEHIPLLSAVPGWLKSTRWELRKVLSFNQGTIQDGKRLSQHLAIHEWQSDQSFSTPEFKHATSTPWRNHIMPRLDKELGERRNFKPHARML